MAAASLQANFDPPLPELRIKPELRVKTNRILIIEDDSALQKVLRRLFSSEGYEVDVVPHAMAYPEALHERPPSAVIVGLQHPRSSGADLRNKIANLIPGPPLVILSASPEVADKVLFLEMGADDYVTIPFSPRELVARMRAVIRRASRHSREMFYVFANVVVDFSSMDVTRSGEKIPLTGKEFKVLEFMTKNAQRLLLRDELLNRVWGYDNYPRTRTVDNHILRLRQKLESVPSDPAHFLTIHGKGYKFVP